MNPRSLCAAILVTTVMLYGCGTDDRAAETEPTETAAAGTADAAVAAETSVELVGRDGQRVGTARLTETAEGVEIAIRASGLPPGPKGFHLHETGRCDPPGFESAGGHFAPMERQHGLENPVGPHAGDMENLPVGEDGSIDTTVTNPRVTLRPGEPNSLVDRDGTALVIHAEQDDQRTDPTGDSGDRIACGVVQAPATR